ncbi:hypothetical protein [Chryseobacterium oryctis]|uniref:Uncharacterized protein n=1 Tax=Chryseobacterium oryctis TaxID=2952618 RepID=A0ABT3HMA4_9FLAO|nr:hypothetical protein [Chryseobacterium oryctis]MCW3160912.1 hypothetical protein [Chryseobacterium oryctis]
MIKQLQKILGEFTGIKKQMKHPLIISLLVLLTSCTIKNVNPEFIEFNHMNAVVIGGDKLVVTLIPTHKKKKRPVIVKIFRKGEFFDKKRISYEQYQQVSGIILSIKQGELEVPQKQNYLVGILDGGNNSITLKKDTLEKKLNIYGISKDYHGKFYEATELILKAANLEIKDVD